MLNYNKKYDKKLILLNILLWLLWLSLVLLTQIGVIIILFMEKDIGFIGFIIFPITIYINYSIENLKIYIKEY
jgi:hypothetical protein